MKTIAIQGEIGSFHHSAAMQWAENDFKIIACSNFKQVFEALHNNSADVAVVAIENSLHGSLNEVYDLLLQYKFPIVGEVAERIHQCLIGYSAIDISQIKTVYSHPVALSQCSTYLDTCLDHAERLEYYDTAASVAKVMSLKNPSVVAIAGKHAALLHSATIIKSNIQNYDANYTRFLVLAKRNTTTPTDDASKASLVIETPHTPGALYTALGVINECGVNMTKLQSRPIQQKVWRYMFYIDIECSAETTHTIVEKLQSLGCIVTVLGVYKKAITISEI